MEELPTIKERLISRFIAARDIVGPRWRRELADSDPFFDTKLGGDFMLQVSGAPTNSRRVGNDRLERVVLGLEKIVESLTEKT